MPTRQRETFDQLMARKGEGEPATLQSMNSLVAANVTIARTLRGMTQERLGEDVGQLTGRRWSKSTVSALERSADGVSVRQFDADDLVAIALALDVPLLFLFLPADPRSHPAARYAPRPVRPDEVPGRGALGAVDVAAAVVGSGDVTAVVGAGDATAILRDRLAGLLGAADLDFLSTDARSERLAGWRDALSEVTAELDAAIDRKGAQS